MDEKKLKEVFRLAGRVLEVDLNRDKDGKSRGHGVIEFEHPVEAVQAICKLYYRYCRATDYFKPILLRY